MTAYIAAAVAVVLFIVVFATGFLLRASGTPYGVPQLTVHKLISLAALGFVGVVLIRVSRDVGLGQLVWVSLIATALFFIVAVATGGMLSAEKEWPSAIGTLHKISPWFTVVAAAATMYLALAAA
jgi:hypothetical protein